MDHIYGILTFKAATQGTASQPRDRLPNHLALKVSEAGIYQSHSSTANKEAVVKWASEHSPWLHPQLSAEGAGKNTHPPVSSWKGFDCTLSKLLPIGPTSNQPLLRC